MTDVEFMEVLLEDLPTREKSSFRQQYEEVQSLPARRSSLPVFLHAYLRSVARMYAATAGAIWFRNPQSSSLSLNASVGMERLGLTEELDAAHRALLDYALNHAKPLLVKPFSGPAAGSTVSNPTDSFLILAPVRNHEDPLAVVELFLGPTPVRGRTATQRKRYVTWMDHLVVYLCQGIEKRFLATAAPLAPALAGLQSVRAEIERHQKAIRDSIEHTLSSFVGWNFGSLKENQTFAAQVHDLLDGLGLRAECPECGEAAIIRCQSAGNSRSGVFLFDHYLETGRTFHGGPTTFPQVKVCSKPPRRRRSRRRRPTTRCVRFVAQSPCLCFAGA